MIAIMDALSPSSPATHITLLKGVQTGGTTNAAENRILFEIIADPGPLLYITATDDLALEWGEKRLEPMIELAGISNRIKSSTKMTGKRSDRKQDKVKKLFRWRLYLCHIV